MYVLALTGGLGSGKSTAAEVFADRGAVVIDLDDVAKTLLDEAPAVRDRVIEEFGPEVRRDDGTEVTVIGYPARLVGATPASYRQAPRVCQDTLEVLEGGLVGTGPGRAGGTGGARRAGGRRTTMSSKTVAVLRAFHNPAPQRANMHRQRGRMG